jgi:hypothetical protein
MRSITQDELAACLIAGNPLEVRDGYVRVADRGERVDVALFELFVDRGWVAEARPGEWMVTEVARAALPARAAAAAGREAPTGRACRWLLDGGRLRLTAPHGGRIECHTHSRPSARLTAAMAARAQSPARRERVSMSLFFELERRGWLREFPGGQEFELNEAGRASLGRAAVVWAGAARADEPEEYEGSDDGEAIAHESDGLQRQTA